MKTRKEIWTKYNNSKKGKTYQKNYYKQNKERVKKRSKNYSQTEKGKEVQKEASSKKRKMHPKEVKARNILNRLFRYGNISNNDFICAVCGNQPIEKHHENYNLWYIFIPLCKDYHTLIHKKENPKYESDKDKI